MLSTRYADRAFFYVGLGIVTAATLMLQIIETRIISVTSWYHLAFFVISIAMFGLTVGAVAVYIYRDRFDPARLSQYLTVAALGFAVSTILAGVAQLTLATGGALSATTFFAWTEFAICLAIPFFFSGICVSLALTRSPYPVGTVYGADLIGAAAGCVGVLVLLSLTSGPASLLWIGVFIGIAALCFGQTASGHDGGAATIVGRVFRRRHLILGILFALAVLNEMSSFGVRTVIVKDRFESPGEIAYDKWNSFSRITVTNSSRGAPSLWGASPKMPPALVEQRWMIIDGSTGTAVNRSDGNLEQLDFLRYDVTNLAYALPDRRSSAVIGVGGGRDVASARLFGVADIHGIEINPIFIDLLTDKFRDYAGLAQQPGVTFEVDEARSWMARSERTFDVIQMSLIDTWAATGAGAFTLSENGLYTVEAWRIFLRRLTEDGVFTVSRWYAPTDVNETGRMVSLAVATLHESGIRNVRPHLFLASAGNVATLIVARSPLSETALRALEERTSSLAFTTLISPRGSAATPALERIVASQDGADLEAATEGSFLDLSPSTDARPFFFNQLRFGRLLEWNVLQQFQNPGVFGGNLTATITLVMLVLISLLLVAATIVLPLSGTVQQVGWSLVAGGTAYFALIGIGFMMVEIALLQRMSVFLGHPVYALSVVLFSLILSTGIGSLLSERLPLRALPQISVWAVLTSGYLVTLPIWLPSLLLQLDSASLIARAGFCVLVLAPAGLLMGFAFPTGMHMVSRIDARPTPWFWGVNGAAGVLAGGVAVLTSIGISIDATLQFGALCYVLLLIPAIAMARGDGSARAPVPRLEAA
jgi:predicted membrane-bound spermidine synthase